MAPVGVVWTWQQDVSCSLRSRRARWTRDFIPDTEMTELVCCLPVGLPVQVDAGEGVARRGVERTHHRLQATGELAGGVVGQVAGGVRFGPELQVRRLRQACAGSGSGR